MELFLFRHAEFEQLYNCTGFNIDIIPLKNRRFVPEAIVTIILCGIYYILYIPCMISMWKHTKGSTCYKLLFVIGILDMAILWILGFLHGILALEGAVYCSYPTLIYFVGTASTCGWIAETSVDLVIPRIYIVLAINRCVEMIFPHFSEILFSGYRVFLWMALCAAYTLYWILFEKPGVFSGVFFGWFFDPFVGYRKDIEGQFENKLHTIHNMVLAIAMPTIYLIFAIALMIKWNVQKINVSKAQKLAFMQVFVFSILNTLCALLYVLMQYGLSPNQWTITLAQFFWLHIHGIPPVIYLLLNKTIREDSYKLVYKMFNPKQHRTTVIPRITTIFHSSVTNRIHADY